MLIDEKENSMEKNLRQQNLNPRSPLGPVLKDKAALRPALRTLTIHKQAQQAHQQQQQQKQV
jgi:hypothetical protein